MSRFILSLLTLLAVAGIAPAGHCVLHYGGNYGYNYGATYYSPYAGYYSYVAPTYYYQPVYEKVKIVHKEVEPDFYASVNSYYRDSLLADAIAYRVMVAQKQGSLPTPPAQSLPKFGSEAPVKAGRGSVSINTAVPQALTAYVASACLKCHNGPGGKGGIDLSNLATCSPLTRWKTYAAVNDGSMPQGGPEAKEEDIKAIIEWRNAGDTAAASAATSQLRNTEPTKEDTHEEALARTDRRRAARRRD